MKRWLKVLLLADFFIVLSVGMLQPIYAIWVSDVGGDVLEASGAWATFAFTSAILMYLVGRWEDRSKHYAPMLVIGYVLRSLTFLGYLFVTNTLQLFAAQVLLGVSTAITQPSYDALYSKHLDKGKAAQQWGIWEGMNLMGTAVAALAGGAIVSFFGFKALFLVMLTLSICGVFASSVLLKKRGARRHPRRNKKL